MHELLGSKERSVNPIQSAARWWPVLALGTFALWGGDWAQFQHDGQRTGRSADAVLGPYRIRWCWLGPDQTIRNRHHTGDPADPELNPGDILAGKTSLPPRVPFAFSGLCQPVIGEGRVFVGDVDGRVYAIDAGDGTTLWTGLNPGGTFTAGALLGDVVVFTSLQGSVRAFDPGSGRLLWERGGMGPFLSAPAVRANAVYAGSTDGRVYAFDCAGQPHWVSPSLEAPIAGGIALDDDGLYVGAENMTFYKLSLADGRVLLRRRVRGQSFAAQWPVVCRGKVYLETSPIPMIGSEYIGEDLMDAAKDVSHEMRLWRQFLRGEGGFQHASPDWQHLTVLETADFDEPFLVPSGPFDGCGQPPDPPAVDAQDRVWTCFKSKWNRFARPCGFGTRHQVDLGPIDPASGDRVLVDNGRVADNAWYAWETDNLYALTFGGPVLYLRQSFRGTVAIHTGTSQARALSNLYHRRDGGVWRGDVQYADDYELGQRVPRPSQQVPYGRPPVAISGSSLFLVESFCLTAVEQHR